MLDSYLTIRTHGQCEIDIKKSQFICALERVYSEKEAKDFIAAKKKEHWKAAHNCSAFIIGDSSDIQRSSDDGEPSGTAGIPMLEVLKKRQVINVVAVVTRYFGGIKLGTGGLIRAYSQAVSLTLDEIGLVEGKLQQEITLTLEYTNLSSLQNFLEKNMYTIKETDYGEQVSLTCLVDEAIVESFTHQATNLLNGQVTFELGSCSYHEIPYTK